MADNKNTQKKGSKKRRKRLGPKKIFLKQTGGKGPKRSFLMNLTTTILIILIFVTAYSFFVSPAEEREEIPLSELATAVKEERVESIVIEGNELQADYKDETLVVAKKESDSALTETLANYGVEPVQLAGVSIKVQEDRGLGFWLLTLSPIIIPVLFIVFFIWYLSRQVKGAGMQAFTFGQSKARIIMPHDTKQKVTFKDIAGSEEAKRELEEVVDFLKNPKKFLNIGAKIPKGIILMGAPGTGKTLLARGVAGEASVAFFSISGSEFVEMFVGVGASRVRDLFKMAKQASPAIIFIDEVDAIGRVRGSGMGGGNDEREQTLNQILVEMDGFEQNEKVIVMAATNRPDVLDPALLRPGRFDRRVTIDLPDRKDREAILKIQSSKMPLAGDVDFGVIAERTPGFSGADIYSLVNEAAILTAREEKKKIEQAHIVASIEKVMLGPERRSHVLSTKEKKITAYHEAGHALVASLLPNADPVHKISIISRGRAAGYTLKLPFEDRKMHTKKDFLDDLAVNLGGYITENIKFGDVSTGPSNDLQTVTDIARAMVTKYGMSDVIGPMALDTSSRRIRYTGNDETADREYSDDLSEKVDAEVSRIVKESYDKAEKLLTENDELLEAIAQKLIEVENLERDEFEDLLRQHGVEPKKLEE